MKHLKSIVLMILFSIICLCSSATASAKSWYTDNKIIRHAGGKIGKYSYTNSKEAVSNSLQQDKNVIEMDLIYTSDHVLVCKHDWDKIKDKSYQTFIETKINNTYTPLTADDLLDLLAPYKDAYLVVDAKSKDITSTYMELVRLCKESGQEELLSRIVVQIYKTSDYQKIKNIYPFKNWIFTFYQLKPKKISEYVKIAKFCKKNKIKVVALPANYVTSERMKVFKKYKIKCYAHTVNSKSSYKKLLKKGVYGVFSDAL